MPAKKKGAKKGTKAKHEEDEYFEPEGEGASAQSSSLPVSSDPKAPGGIQNPESIPQIAQAQLQASTDPSKILPVATSPPPTQTLAAKAQPQKTPVQSTTQPLQQIQQKSVEEQKDMTTVGIVAPLPNIAPSALQITATPEVKDFNELSLREKKELRKQRFKMNADNPMMSTLDAQSKLDEEKQKRLLRAQKFGLESKEIEAEKKRMRAEKFGLNQKGDLKGQQIMSVSSSSTHTVTNLSKTLAEEEKQKKAMRAIKFGTGPALDTQEEEEKRKKRLERFKPQIEAQGEQVQGSRVVKRVKL